MCLGKIQLIALGLDAGGNGTRWSLVDSHNMQPLADGVIDSISGHLYAQTDMLILQQILATLVLPMAPDCIVAGISGLETELAEQVIQQQFMQHFQLSAAQVIVKSDQWLAYHAYFKAGEGIVVYAGTGSFAYHQPCSSAPLRLGGYGLLLDDAGGGAWIAQQALQHILRGEDRHPTSQWNQPLGQYMAQAVGNASWQAVCHYVYSQDRGALGRLALAVAAAAHTDNNALGILNRASAALVELALIARQRVGQALPVVLAGGVTRLHPIINRYFLEQVTNSRIATEYDLAHLAACFGLKYGIKHSAYES